MVLRTLSKFSLSSFVATMYAQGCVLLLEGAQRAASKMLFRSQAKLAYRRKLAGSNDAARVHVPAILRERDSS